MISASQLITQARTAFCKLVIREDFSLRLLLVALITLLLALNYLLWLRDDRGVRQVYLLHQEIEEQRAENALLQARNTRLEAEIQSLDSLDAIEEQARMEFGMIQEGETFFQFLFDPIPLVNPTADAAAIQQSHE